MKMTITQPCIVCDEKITIYLNKKEDVDKMLGSMDIKVNKSGNAKLIHEGCKEFIWTI